MRAGGSFFSTLLNDWESAVMLMTAPAVPSIGIVAADAVQRPHAPALPILSSSSWSTLLLEYGSTSYRAAYSRLKEPTWSSSFVRLSWLGSRVFVTAVEALLKSRPTPLGTPLNVSPGLVRAFLTNVTGLTAWSLNALRKTSLPVIFRSSPMAQISRASL